MRSCSACGFAGLPDVDPTSVEHHKQHRLQHLRKFPNASEQTREVLNALVRHAENNAFRPKNLEVA